jgi:Fe-S-cluster containining protein
VTPEEIEALARFRNETVNTFSRKFVRRVGDRYSLVERPGGDCVFWDSEQGCTVYEARPTQCRTWPFWPENVETPDDWKYVRSVCPGAGKGQLFTVEQVLECVRKSPT